MRKYVAGFLIWRGWVLLVKKTKPDWQVEEETLGKMPMVQHHWRLFAVELWRPWR